MLTLARPDARIRPSFLAAMDEFVAEGRVNSMTFEWIDRFGSRWRAQGAFEDFCESLRAEELPETPRPTGWVPCSTFWAVDDGEYLGRISIRHQLTDSLLEVGGHLGYDVRPTRRRRGHATEMLAGALVEAAKLGINSALITCDSDNIGSVKVIEANGGRLEDVRHGKRRYWAPTG